MRKYRDITILGKCNLNCMYCEHPEFEIDEEKTICSLRKVIHSFDKDTTCFRVEARGEITLYQKVIDEIKKLIMEGYRLEILSNGLLLDKVLDGFDKLKCVVSLDGHTAAMNEMRQLSKKKVDVILHNIFKYYADIQMVYLKQDISEINEFIMYLEERQFRGLLHIFPCSIGNKIISPYLDYRKLKKASFLPSAEYFRRWEYIAKNGCRSFQCDFNSNGYIYYIYNNTIKMLKCDGNSTMLTRLHRFGEERYIEYDCLNCINNNELNNSRKFVCE